jgi:type IV pilus assembly protein PilX
MRPAQILSNSASMRHRPPSKQRGVSLIVVLIFLLLAIITVLGAFRSSFLNEKMVGNESDYNRAFAAAEALIRDAEMDIRGRRPPYNFPQADGNLGFPCRPTTNGSPTEITSKPGYENSCRLRNTAATPNTTMPWFPRGNDEFDEVENIVITQGTNRCLAGICFPQNMTDMANIEALLIDPNTIGVPYGSFTRTDLNVNLDNSKSNALLTTTPAGGTNPAIPRVSTQGWYVIEAFRYGTAISGGGVSHPATQLKPDPANSVVYRITAVVRGLRGTVVVLKSTFVPNPANQSI